jgi:hypothetical protein
MLCSNPRDLRALEKSGDTPRIKKEKANAPNPENRVERCVHSR